jgi:hypothetical protein
VRLTPDHDALDVANKVRADGLWETNTVLMILVADRLHLGGVRCFLSSFASVHAPVCISVPHMNLGYALYMIDGPE